MKKVIMNLNDKKLVILQYASAIVSSLTGAGYGAYQSWTSPSLPYLTSNKAESPLLVTQFDTISSFSTLGFLLGYLLNPVFSKQIGSKYTLLLFALPQIACWILTVKSQVFTLICLARTLGGIGYGGGLCIMIEYLTEISNFGNRSFFFSLNNLFTCAGNLLPILYGTYLSYYYMNIALLIMTIISFIIFFFFPDSSFFLEMNEKKEESIKNLMNSVDSIAKLHKKEVYTQFGSDCVKNGPETAIEAQVETEAETDTNANFKNAPEVEFNSKSSDVDECGLKIDPNIDSTSDFNIGTETISIKCSKEAEVAICIKCRIKTSNINNKTKSSFSHDKDDVKNDTEYDDRILSKIGVETLFGRKSQFIKDAEGTKLIERGDKLVIANVMICRNCGRESAIKVVNKYAEIDTIVTEDLKTEAHDIETVTSVGIETTTRDSDNDFEDTIETEIMSKHGTQTITNELDTKENSDEKKNNFKQSKIWKLFTLSNNLRALMIIICLNGTDIFGGHLPLVSYTQQFLTHRALVLSPEKAALVLSTVRFFAILVSTQIVEKIEKRSLLLWSGIAGSISYALSGVFFFLDSRNYDISHIAWFPICWISVSEVANAVGNGNAFFALQGELFADDVKSLAISVTNILYIILAFFALVKFQELMAYLGVFVIFWFFSVFLMFVSFILFLIVPEMKGKTIDEIQEKLKRNA